jgi:hypothetical protein
MEVRKIIQTALDRTTELLTEKKVRKPLESIQKTSLKAYFLCLLLHLLRVGVVRENR